MGWKRYPDEIQSLKLQNQATMILDWRLMGRVDRIPARGQGLDLWITLQLELAQNGQGHPQFEIL